MSGTKQQSQSAASLPGFSARFEKLAAGEAAIFKVFIADRNELASLADLTEEKFAAKRIKPLGVMFSKAGQPGVVNSFPSLTAALRASWWHLEGTIGKAAFTEKGHWGVLAYQYEASVKQPDGSLRKVSFPAWQFVLPIFADKSEVIEGEVVANPKPQAKAVPVQPKPVVIEDQSPVIVQPPAQKSPGFFERMKAAAAAVQDKPVEAPSLPVEAPAAPKAGKGRRS